MHTIEGEVTSVSHVEGEGDLELLVAALELQDDSDEVISIMLAPETVCRQIGFFVEEGDRLRARVFLDPDGPARVQKIQNFTQGTMVRFRTLHRIPLWSTNGTWQGGPLRTVYGPHQHGRGWRGGGPPK